MTNRPWPRPRFLTFGRFVLDGLLEESDVLEGAKEQNHLVVLVPDGSHLHVEPHGISCREAFQVHWFVSKDGRQSKR